PSDGDRVAGRPGEGKRFMGSHLSNSRMHWDHEPKSRKWLQINNLFFRFMGSWRTELLVLRPRMERPREEFSLGVVAQAADEGKHPVNDDIFDRGAEGAIKAVVGQRELGLVAALLQVPSR